MNTALENAIFYCKNNPKQLAALARQESQRADMTGMMLAAVLNEHGPVTISNDHMKYIGCGFSLVPSEDGLTTNVMPFKAEAVKKDGGA